MSKEAAEAGARSSSVRIVALEKEIAQLREEAEHVEVLTDRCARLEVRIWSILLVAVSYEEGTVLESYAFFSVR